MLLGKTTSPEYGWKGVTDSALFGATHNPWKIGRTPGGSSGGGVAAEAVGMGNLAVGTDGAGSVRIPCSFTGLFGLKPTQARVPLWPPSAQGTLSHIGPMTRTVRDAAMMMNVMARPDPRDPYGRPDDVEDYLKGFDKGVKGLRIAYSPNLGFVEKEKIDRDVAQAVENAVKVFQTLGAKVVEDSPDLHGARSAPHPQRALAVATSLTLVKTFSAEKRALMDPGLLKAAEHGANLGQEAVVTAIHQRQQVGVIMNAVRGQVRPAADADHADDGLRGERERRLGRRRRRHRLDAVHAHLQPDAPAGGDDPLRPRPRGPADRPADRRRATPAMPWYCARQPPTSASARSRRRQWRIRSEASRREIALPDRGAGSRGRGGDPRCASRMPRAGSRAPRFRIRYWSFCPHQLAALVGELRRPLVGAVALALDIERDAVEDEGAQHPDHEEIVSAASNVSSSLRGDAAARRQGGDDAHANQRQRERRHAAGQEDTSRRCPDRHRGRQNAGGGRDGQEPAMAGRGYIIAASRESAMALVARRTVMKMYLGAGMVAGLAGLALRWRRNAWRLGPTDGKGFQAHPLALPRRRLAARPRLDRPRSRLLRPPEVRRLQRLSRRA